MSKKNRKPLKHLKNIPQDLGFGEGGETIPKLYDYFQQIDEYIDELKSQISDGGNGDIEDLETKVENLEKNIEDKADKSSLGDYAKTSDLSDYAKASDLDDYAKSDDIPSDYLTESDLSDYAKTSDLDDYASQSDLNALSARVDDLEADDEE